MTVASLEGYLTKKEIEENYNRSHRSLSRDFSQAVRMGDIKVLSNLKLRTDDGNEIIGKDVTLEMIQKLSNQGLSPTWYAKVEWVEQRYSKDIVKKKTQTQEEGSQPFSVYEKPSTSSTDPELVSTLKAQIVRLQLENDRKVEEHQKDKESFMEQIKMFKDMFDTLKEDHTDTKSLLKEVHQVMGKFADLSLLGTSTPPSDISQTEGGKSTGESNVNQRTDTVEAVIVEEPEKSKSTAKKPVKKKKQTAKASSPVKKNKSLKSKPVKHRWYETPTLNRFISKSTSK